MNTGKVLVAHPLKQHSFQTAIALKEAGMLENCQSLGVQKIY